MAQETKRRTALAEAATDHVLEHGLVGLSLRPLATALGTSDRMLLYHFADKDDLVATVLRVSNDRSIREVEKLPDGDDVADAVRLLWHALTTGPLEHCQRLYVEAAALGLLGREPYAGVVRQANEGWVASLVGYLRRSGCPEERAGRAVLLLDATLMGLHLDLPLDRDTPAVQQAVADLAEAVAAIAAARPDQGRV
ncbi:MAG TPA: TetR/AcrR family transcriptional regulator [Marmoricola sp.]|nr:TetR/AcrR family transcriptional regulator [Marmoricola sp.]